MEIQLFNIFSLFPFLSLNLIVADSISAITGNYRESFSSCKENHDYFGSSFAANKITSMNLASTDHFSSVPL